MILIVVVCCYRTYKDHACVHCRRCQHVFSLRRILRLQLGCIVRDRYPNAARHIDYRVFINVHRFLLEGRLPHQAHGEGRPVAPYEELVLRSVQEDPSISVRTLERDIGVLKSTVGMR